MRIKPLQKWVCQQCGKVEFVKKFWQLKRKVCSKHCAGLYYPVYKIGQFKKGRISPNKGKKLLYLQGEKHFNWKGGKPKCLVCGEQVSAYKVKYCLRHKATMNSGENHYLWKGGIRSKEKLIRDSVEYRQWREIVFKRDNYTCQNCNQKGGRLQADHIKPFALFPELRLIVSNGRTLCKICHYQLGWNYFRYKKNY